jgi:hypothetical protein
VCIATGSAFIDIDRLLRPRIAAAASLTDSTNPPPTPPPEGTACLPIPGALALVFVSPVRTVEGRCEDAACSWGGGGGAAADPEGTGAAVCGCKFVGAKCEFVGAFATAPLVRVSPWILGWSVLEWLV